MTYPSWLALDPVRLKNAVKMALAAVIAFYVTESLGLKQGFWAVVALILVMQTNLGGSLTAGLSRLLGTLAGAALGTVSVLTLGTGPMALGLGLGLTILICSYLTARHDSFRIAGITAAVIVLLSGQGVDAVEVCVSRVIEIAIGVVVGLGVTFFVWPSRAKQGLATGIAAVLGQLAGFYGQVFAAWPLGSADVTGLMDLREKLRRSMAANRKLLGEAGKEPGGLSKPEQIMISLIHFENRILEDILSMLHAVHTGNAISYPSDLEPELNALALATMDTMERLSADIAAVRAPDKPLAIESSLARLEERMTILRRQRAYAMHDLDGVVRLFTFYFGMRSVAEEMRGMSTRVAEMAAG